MKPEVPVEDSVPRAGNIARTLTTAFPAATGTPTQNGGHRDHKPTSKDNARQSNGHRYYKPTSTDNARQFNGDQITEQSPGRTHNYDAPGASGNSWQNNGNGTAEVHANFFSGAEKGKSKSKV